MRRPIVRAVVRVLGDDDEDAGDDLPRRPFGRLLDLRHGCGHVLGAQPVEDGAVGLLPGQVQHARAQRGQVDGRQLLGDPSQAEALDAERVEVLGDLLAAEGQAQEAQRVADASVLVLEAHAVPVGHDHLGRRTEPAGEATGCGVGHGGQALGQERGTAGVGRGDGHAEIQLRFPGSGQGQRREPVRAVDLGRPEVGVPELAQAGEPLSVRVQRDPVEGDRDAGSGRPGRRGAALMRRDAPPEPAEPSELPATAWDVRLV